MTDPKAELNNLRSHVGSIDTKIVHLLNERANLSQNIGTVKKELQVDETKNIEVYAPGQEKAVFERIADINSGPLSNEALSSIYREIMSASISLQKDVVIGYLGPKGTFTHQAAQSRFGDSVTYRSLSSNRAVFTALQDDSLSYAVLPIENSSTGLVHETLDPFTDFSQIKIRAEIYIPVVQSLLSHFQPSGIRRIYSHRVAFAQCSKWLDINFPNVERVNVSSTARAAELASTEMYSAAICSDFCSKAYDIPILQKSIADNQVNITRFWVLGKSTENETGDDRTFISFTVDHRQPGALCDGLEVFKSFGLNLTKIDTRPCPSKLKPWHYLFHVEFEGHSTNPKVKEALEQLQKFCIDVTIQGSFPNQKPASE